jgi:predicted amidohydrolase
MTQNANFKRRVRARAAKTGESYTAALKHIRGGSPGDAESKANSLRLAVAQTTLYNNPGSIDELHRSGAEMRRLMRQASDAGARLVHFPEGATCSPNKRIMSTTGPREIGRSDWSRVQWMVLREELDVTRELARALRLWTVFGSVHQLTQPHRPHNSLYVVSDRGELVTRYDERMLSNTKVSFMYTPGKIPVTFEIDGLRFGCALGMETHYPEIFVEYERLDVDCVLFSTTGETPINAPAFAAEVQGHAASNACWVSFSAHAPQSLAAPAAIAAPDGRWAARCPADGTPAIVVFDISSDPGDPARPWRRTARAGIYDRHRVEGDPRSDGRDRF